MIILNTREMSGNTPFFSASLKGGKSAAALILLLRCAITGEKPDMDCLEGLDLSALYSLAERHSLAAATNIGLEYIGIQDTHFREAYAKALRKVLSLETDKHKLLFMMEEQGIWYMPLKGAVLKDVYPRIGMREMSDYDILYDAERDEDVRKILTGMGYIVEEYDVHSVDSYVKPPVCRFEMHRKLIPPHMDNIYKYYHDIKSRLVKDEGNGFGWHFLQEDFYVYLLVHEYKHYMAGGSGLRSLLDTWVFLRKYGEELNWDYIENELDILGIREFEEENRCLTIALFQGVSLNAQQMKLLDYIMGSGTFGTVGNAVQQQVERLGGGLRGKLLFIKERVLMPKKALESAYPFFYRHKALIPFLYPYRTWKLFFRSRKKVTAELKALLGTNKKEKNK